MVCALCRIRLAATAAKIRGRTYRKVEEATALLGEGQRTFFSIRRALMTFHHHSRVYGSRINGADSSLVYTHVQCWFVSHATSTRLNVSFSRHSNTLFEI